MEYRGIKIDDSVKLINADGSFNKSIKSSLDDLVDSLESRGHKLLDTYKGNSTDVVINFGCGHKQSKKTPKGYKKGQGCPKCSGRSSEQAKVDFLQLIVGSSTSHKVLI